MLVAVDVPLFCCWCCWLHWYRSTSVLTVNPLLAWGLCCCQRQAELQECWHGCRKWEPRRRAPSSDVPHHTVQALCIGGYRVVMAEPS
jgi:hypothetical protein